MTTYEQFCIDTYKQEIESLLEQILKLNYKIERIEKRGKERDSAIQDSSSMQTL